MLTVQRSRTTLLSGKFYHNNKVASASDPGCMRMNTSKATNPEWWHNTVTARLHADHGYTTGPSALHAGRSTGVAPRGPLYGGRSTGG